MVPLLIVLLLAALLFGIGIAIHLLWIVAVIVLAIWIVGFVVGARNKTRWYSW